MHRRFFFAAVVVAAIVAAASAALGQAGGTFAPNGNYATPFTASAVTTRSTLPTGAVTVVYNTGSVAAYCRLGDATVTATTSHDQVSAGGFMGFTVGSNSNIACITATSSTVLNLSGGSGIPQGSPGLGGAGGASTFQPLASVGITPTDRTIASASGSSQQLMAANGSRHSMLIVNTGNANCGVNPTGGTAVIGGAGTITLAPLGSYYAPVPTLSAVTVICTAGQPIYANEN